MEPLEKTTTFGGEHFADFIKTHRAANSSFHSLHGHFNAIKGSVCREPILLNHVGEHDLAPLWHEVLLTLKPSVAFRCKGLERNSLVVPQVTSQHMIVKQVERHRGILSTNGVQQTPQFERSFVLVSEAIDVSVK